ncbi:hypothetical protein CcaverHIS002_0603670 [Cutaneotrichosporon cavernicola]|uniref:Uncharacterized protein n=1 Tax=Cutaneotrichosporon cavernicola TaxID=279322 RepID=A0AA48QXS1_9TREE|nr:uncharacterized protein CcaverHIS019_0603130 [Cutaneotrichosporon cavernicola]BEI86080.1 hypothetical protein CcaverHIS002_0603670 [Cutaneotrichosporon cavernicola]BEI93854.1 hypothetical protein CcaverHIS019_0603130 [Cutaneotrichosporon cavernicola]
MSRDEGNDPWNAGIIRTPSPTSSNADEFVTVNGFVQLSRDNDLANELDLSRREDHAIVKETPFTLANLRVQQQAQKVRTSAREKGRVGGSIRTADGSDESPFIVDDPRTSAPKKRRTMNTGWTDSSGTALDAGPIRKKGKRVQGEQSEVKSKPKKEVRKDVPARKAPPKRKKCKNSDDKVEFHRLPTITSHSDFPILAGLERQRSLPKKKPAKKDSPLTTSIDAPARGSAGSFKPPQTKLDFDALIGGYRHKTKAKAPPPSRTPSPAETESTNPDLSAALYKEFGMLKNRGPSKPVTKSKLTSTAGLSRPTPGPFKTSARPADLPVSMLKFGPPLAAATRPPAIIDITSPDPTVNTSPRNKSLSSDRGHVRSPKPNRIIQPIAVRHNPVELLETLAAEHDFSGAKSKKASLLPERSAPHGNTYQPPQRDVETAFPMHHGLYDRPGLDGRPEHDVIDLGTDVVFMYKQRPIWQQDDQTGEYGGYANDRQPGPSDRNPDLAGQDGPQQDGYSGHEFADQDWQQPTDRGVDGLWGQERRQDYDVEVNHGPSSLAGGHNHVQRLPGDRYDPQSRGECGSVARAPTRLARVPSPNDLFTRKGTIHGMSMRAPTRIAPKKYSPPQQYSTHHHHRTITSDAYRTPFRAPVGRTDRSSDYSPRSLANAKGPITPTHAYTQAKRRESKPLAGSWHKVLGSPSPPPAHEEWSTLPTKRQRVTIHPNLSRGKSSKFRLPINLLSGRKLPSQKPDPLAQSPPSNNEPSLYTGGVTITKWTPSALSQQPAAESSSTTQRGYVPSNMRVLECMGEPSPEQNGLYPDSTPHRSRPAPYFDPPHSRGGSSSYQPRSGVNPYATPRSLGPGPSIGPADHHDDDDDDWADSWRLSVHVRGGVGPKNG